MREVLEHQDDLQSIAEKCGLSISLQSKLNATLRFSLERGALEHWIDTVVYTGHQVVLIYTLLVATYTATCVTLSFCLRQAIFCKRLGGPEWLDLEHLLLKTVKQLHNNGVTSDAVELTEIHGVKKVLNTQCALHDLQGAFTYS